MKNLSFRRRLTLWYTLTVVILLAVFFIFIYSTLAPTVQASVRERVDEDMSAVSASLYTDEMGLHMEEVLISPDTLYAVYAPDGAALYANHHQRWFLGAPLDEGVVRTVTAGGQEWVLQDSTVMGNDGTVTAYVRTGAPVGANTDTTSALFRILLIALPLGGVCALLIGMRMTAGSLRRIDDITRAAEEIRQGDFSRRLAVHGTNDEIGRLECTFNSMLDSLEESMAREKQFTSDASHELRTPLAVILGAAQTTLEHVGAQSEDYAAALRIIYKRGTDMQSMLSQMLLLARGDAQASMMEHSRLNLSDIVLDISEEFAQQAAERRMQLETAVDPDICICGDLMMMTRAVMNLLSNAIRYGREGGWIRVSLREEGARAVLRVADNGEGIRSEDLPHIFDRFYRADGSRASSGFGLGLALAKRITELHEGSICADSTAGAGTVFTLTLPLASREADQSS